MKIAEIFYSVQGEGSLVGAPSVFIRTSGCNLRCVWCDTPYTSWNPEGEELSVDEIVVRVEPFRAPYAVLTGGEPMIAPAIVELAARLRERGMHITIETAGTVYKEVACDLMSISPKLANSTPEGPFRSQHERLRIQPQVLRQLTARYTHQLKFVVAEPEDLRDIQTVLSEIQADASRVILMPEGRNPQVLHERSLWLVELCKEHGYRFSPRLHVDLWGDRRGV
jgi:7-carboxy-7-deazaguanine synthase